MSKKATTLITVDTEKLRGQKPGKVEDRTIIKMYDTSGAKDFSYKDPTKSDFKDNLIQKVDQGAEREWTIEALNKKDNVSFVKFDSHDPLDLYDDIPVRNGARIVKTRIKKGLTVHTKIQYTFYFEFEGNEYFWDPVDETRHP